MAEISGIRIPDFGKNKSKEQDVQKKYVLFDLDGTLTDPKVGICTCVQYALKSFGIEVENLDDLEPFIGPPLIDSFKEFYNFSDEDAKVAVEKYRERFSQVGLFENEVYPGIHHMLKKLKKYGFHLAVASSKPQVYVERILDHFHMSQYFEVVVGSNLDGTRTDKSEIIDEVFRQFFKGGSVRKDEIFMVGDRKFDVIGAKSHGVSSIAVAYGYAIDDELLEAKADYIVFSAAELEDLLMRETNWAAQGRISRPKNVQMDPIPYKSILVLALWFFVFVIGKWLGQMAFTYVFSFIGIALGADRPGMLFTPSTENELGFVLSGSLSTFVSMMGYCIAGLALINPTRMMVKYTERDSRLLHLFRPAWWKWLAAAVFTIGLVMGAQILVILTGVATKSETYQSVAQNQYSGAFWIGLFSYGIISPLAEEMLFRGIIYGYLRRHMRFYSAILITSVIFALYHGNIVQGVYAFIIGVVMCVGYEYFGTFIAPVVIHALANLIAYTGTYIFMDNKVVISWPFMAAMFAFAAVGGVILYKFKDAN